MKVEWYSEPGNYSTETKLLDSNFDDG